MTTDSETPDPQAKRIAAADARARLYFILAGDKLDLVTSHTMRLACCVESARQAMRRAAAIGRRTDCLVLAVESLTGALRCALWEDGCGDPEAEVSRG